MPEDIPNPLEKEKLISTGEGETPLAVPGQLEADIRTMASDLQSLKETGSAVKPIIAPVKEEEIIQPDQIGLPPIPAPSTPTMPSPEIPLPASAPQKKFPLWIPILIVGILAIAAAGYFLVYPFVSPLFNQKIPPEPAVTPPSSPPPPAAPTSTPAAKPVTPVGHVSLFKTPPDQTLSMQPLELLGLESWFKEATSSLLVEIVLLPSALATSSTSTLTFPYLLEQNKWPSDLANSFEDNYSLYIYRDKKGGLWPGVVGQLKSGFNSLEMQKKYGALIESITKKDPASFFWTGSTGADFGQAQVWKNIKFGSLNARYLSFSKPGYTINYVWVGNKLAIGSSYDGFREVLKKL